MNDFTHFDIYPTEARTEQVSTSTGHSSVPVMNWIGSEHGDELPRKNLTRNPIQGPSRPTPELITLDSDSDVSDNELPAQRKKTIPCITIHDSSSSESIPEKTEDKNGVSPNLSYGGTQPWINARNSIQNSDQNPAPEFDQTPTPEST